MAIKDYIGVRFNENGATPEEGFNCWTLCWYVAYHEYGIELPSYQGRYQTPLDFDELQALIGDESTTNWQEVSPGLELPGDVVILRLQGQPIHAGLVTTSGTMLHVYRGIETVTEDYRSRLWRNRVSGIFRYEEPTRVPA